MKKRILTAVLATILAVGMIPTAAMAADGARNVVDVAFKYYGQKATAATFGFSDEWCGSFLYYIAKEAGEGAAMGGSEYTMQYNPRSMDWFIANGAKVGYFYDALPKNTEAHLSSSQKMNKSDYVPQLGDIIYFDWDGYGNGGLYHVEIVTHIDGRGISTVGGNTNGNNWWESSVNARWSIIDDSPNIVAYARPNYSGVSIPVETTPTPTPSATKTQYRYHRYIDNNGEYAICPYYGNSTYHTVMHLEYTDWLDAPLPEVKRGYVNYLEHPYQGASCDRAGCIDGATFQVHRHEDARGNVWYYEETRTVAVDEPSTPTPESPKPTTPESSRPVISETPKPTTPETPKPTIPETTPPTPMPAANCDKGHTWEWEIVKPAACEVDGLEERVCEVCGQRETRTITAPGHDHYIKQETDTFTYYVCADCGEGFVEEKARMPEQPTPSGDMGYFVDDGTYAEGLFSDVKATDWYSANVSAAYGLGLMKGTGGDRFSPTNSLTLGEAVTLAARLHSIYYTGTEEFPRYDGGNWYDPYVDYAREKGIIRENFNYALPATREEFVHILAAALPEKELSPVAAAVTFADASRIIYNEDVGLLQRAGVISGIREGDQLHFRPGNTITRAEVAAVITRMAKPELRKS